MKKESSAFLTAIVLFLFLFSLFMCWYLPSVSSLRTKTAETRQSLETSRGRENKQQAEYDKAVAELPVIQEQLREALPLAEKASENVDLLKARRKELRSEKQELEQKLSGAESSPLEENANE